MCYPYCVYPGSDLYRSWGGGHFSMFSSLIDGDSKWNKRRKKPSMASPRPPWPSMALHSPPWPPWPSMASMALHGLHGRCATVAWKPSLSIFHHFVICTKRMCFPVINIVWQSRIDLPELKILVAKCVLNRVEMLLHVLYRFSHLRRW